MGQNHKFRECRMPFLLRDIRKKILASCTRVAAGDGAICSKNRKIVPYHRANPNTRNGARLRSPSPIMAPDNVQNHTIMRTTYTNELITPMVMRPKVANTA